MALRWAALAWAVVGFVVELPLADAQPECPEAADAAECEPAPEVLSPGTVLLNGLGIVGSLLLLRPRATARS